MGRRLDPSDFFGDNLQREELELPAPLAGSILVRALSGAQQDDYELRMALGTFKSRSYRAWLAYHCVVNDDGSLFFARTVDGEAVPEDVVIDELAAANPWGLLARIADKVSELSGLEPIDADAVKKSLSGAHSDESGE